MAMALPLYASVTGFSATPTMPNITSLHVHDHQPSGAPYCNTAMPMMVVCQRTSLSWFLLVHSVASSAPVQQPPFELGLQRRAQRHSDLGVPEFH